MPINIKKYYKKSFDIIKFNRKIIYFVTILYIIFLLGGIIYYASTYKDEFSPEYKKERDNAMRDILLKDNFYDNFIYIFSHNFIASLFRIISGVLFAVFPLFLIINGAFSSSYSLFASIADKGFYFTLNAWLPHSLIEIPAFILSSSLGVMIFLSLFKPKYKLQNLIKAYKDSLIVFACIILPMLFFAAVIESILIVNFWF